LYVDAFHELIKKIRLKRMNRTALVQWLAVVCPASMRS